MKFDQIDPNNLDNRAKRKSLFWKKDWSKQAFNIFNWSILL